jgi:ATP-binding cassette subfamily F protein 3
VELHGASKRYGDTPILRDLTLVLAPGDRLGVVGPNGIGKTTLMKILAGAEPADAGEVVRPKGARVGYLAQEIARTTDQTVLEAVMDGAEDIRAAEAELVAAEAELAGAEGAAPEDAEALAHRHAEALERVQLKGGFTLEARAHEILRGLGFSEEKAVAPLTTLSGGWVMRAQLARLLLSRPELLLLDEPTNHLDLESMAWLEGFLRDYPGAWAVVSHDRTFLNHLVDRVAELTPDGLFVYEGDYDAYVEARAELEAQLAKAEKGYEKRRREIQAFVDRFRAKATKARQAQSRLKRLEKMEAEDKPPAAPRRPTRTLAFDLPQPARAGEVVLTLEGVTKGYGAVPVYDGLDLTIRRGERVALLGENGAGKSTLLRLLAGDLAPDAGRRVVGHKAEAFYFAQHQAEALDGSLTILETMRALLPLEAESRVRGLLGAFLFSGETVDKPVRVLSGGEKSRLALAKMLARPANVLLLDEPTNHLDLPSREMLESALAGFGGTLVFISHDRFFINRVATRVVEIQPGGRVTDFPGDYDYYLWKRARLAAEARGAESGGAGSAGAAGAAGTATAAPKAKSQAALDRERRKAEAREAGKRAKEAARLESEIAAAEARMTEIDALLCEPGIHADGGKTRALLAEREQVAAGLPGLYAAWEAAAG